MVAKRFLRNIVDDHQSSPVNKGVFKTLFNISDEGFLWK